jgi:hypothetical protein
MHPCVYMTAWPISQALALVLFVTLSISYPAYEKQTTQHLTVGTVRVLSALFSDVTTVSSGERRLLLQSPLPFIGKLCHLK